MRSPLTSQVKNLIADLILVLFSRAIADQYVSVSNVIALDHWQNRDRGFSLINRKTAIALVDLSEFGL